MKPNGGGRPTGKIAQKITYTFGDYSKFSEAFSSTAASQFGSGWAWLVKDVDTKVKRGGTPPEHVQYSNSAGYHWVSKLKVLPEPAGE